MIYKDGLGDSQQGGTTFRCCPQIPTCVSSELISSLADWNMSSSLNALALSPDLMFVIGLQISNTDSEFYALDIDMLVLTRASGARRFGCAIQDSKGGCWWVIQTVSLANRATAAGALWSIYLNFDSSKFVTQSRCPLFWTWHGALSRV